MDWTELIDKLLKSGMTQVQLAERCGVSQASVSALYRGNSKSPSFEFGTKLIQLRDERVTHATQPGALSA